MHRQLPKCIYVLSKRWTRFYYYLTCKAGEKPIDLENISKHGFNRQY
jgi:hypothetical protein